MFIKDVEIGSNETTYCTISNRQQVSGSITKLTAIEISDLLGEYVKINQNSATFNYGNLKIQITTDGLIVGDKDSYHVVINTDGVFAYNELGNLTARLESIDYSS